MPAVKRETLQQVSYSIFCVDTPRNVLPNTLCSMENAAPNSVIVVPASSYSSSSMHSMKKKKGLKEGFNDR